MGIGAGLAPAGWMLAACGGDEAAPPGSSTTTRAPGTTLPLDPERAWWLQADYAPVTEEVTATALEVRGALPPELSGLYVKNTSNPRHGVSPHWFFGDGMVHAPTAAMVHQLCELAAGRITRVDELEQPVFAWR